MDTLTSLLRRFFSISGRNFSGRNFSGHFLDEFLDVILKRLSNVCLPEKIGCLYQSFAFSPGVVCMVLRVFSGVVAVVGVRGGAAIIGAYNELKTYLILLLEESSIKRLHFHVRRHSYHTTG